MRSVANDALPNHPIVGTTVPASFRSFPPLISVTRTNPGGRSNRRDDALSGRSGKGVRGSASDQQVALVPRVWVRTVMLVAIPWRELWMTPPPA